MQHLWEEAGIEPAISDLLADPIAELLRARDGLSELDVWRAVAAARRELVDESRAA